MNQHIVKVSCVSYLNSAPFVHGINQHDFSGRLELSLDIPSVCAEKLISGKADIGLVPVASIIDIPNAKRISNWCIGADGPVKSVTLLSSVPLNKIKTVLLDFHSVTSVNLIKVLAKFYWKINPVWTEAQSGFEDHIGDATAGLVIGDRSLKLQKNYPFVYDLSEEWKKFTGLPFVFACWVSNKNIDQDFLKLFDISLAYGIKNIHEIVDKLEKEPNFFSGTKSYLMNSLRYEFTEEMKKGMELFLNYKSMLANSEIKVLQ